MSDRDAYPTPAPEAIHLVDEVQAQLGKLRAQCSEQADRHQDLAEFYRNEIQVIDRFLVTDHMAARSSMDAKDISVGPKYEYEAPEREQLKARKR